MNFLPIHIKFSDTVEEEVKFLQAELKFKQIIENLQKGKEISQETREEIQGIILLVSDLFSTELPAIDTDPQITLIVASRDINLGRLLRERGIFRLYRLLKQINEHGLPLFTDIINPDTDENFKRQEEFIGWFCREAHVARSLIFPRIATINKLEKLGFTLEHTFDVVISKPFAVREILNMVAKWEDGEIYDVDPDIAEKIAEKIQYPDRDKLSDIAQKVRNDPDNYEQKDDLINAFKPVLISLMDEVAEHPSATDVMDFVRHDILSRPEINYRWELDSQSLLVDLVNKEIDKSGTEFVISITTVPFSPQVLNEVPKEIIRDIVKRLPIKNKNLLDI